MEKYLREKLEEAIKLAVTKHTGAVDKAEEPYILHPLGLMMKMDSPFEMMAAVLHDVIEDTDTTLEDLTRDGFPVEVIEAVDALTHREDVEYFDYVRRCRTNKIARKVKYADASDNRNVGRIKNPIAKDFERVEKYNRVLQMLNCYKEFYEDERYDEIGNNTKTLLERIFKIFEDAGTTILPYFVQNYQIIIKAGSAVEKQSCCIEDVFESMKILAETDFLEIQVFMKSGKTNNIKIKRVEDIIDLQRLFN